jgi:hypothetical protein
MGEELELMTVDELNKALHDMIHKTEKARKSFVLSDIEYGNAIKFAEKHTRCESRSAMSERFEYSFIPGGIGTVKVIKCLVCGIKENITDFDCW